jgi:hypothetical protein
MIHSIDFYIKKKRTDPASDPAKLFVSNRIRPQHCNKANQIRIRNTATKPARHKEDQKSWNLIH